MADPDTAAPWIKAVPVPVREKAVRYARMDDCTMAEWLAKAVETQANQQDENRVIPPGKPDERSVARSVALGGAAGVLQALATAAAAGLPVSKAATRETVALIRDHIRVGRGLPPRQTRLKIGQTRSPVLDKSGMPDEEIRQVIRDGDDTVRIDPSGTLQRA